MYAIQTEEIVKKFGDTTALDGLNLQVKSGEIFGIVGPDGAGKTTLMRILTGILTPDSGKAYVENLETVKNAEKIKKIIGYMSQRFGLYPYLTVIENIKFYADIYSVPKQEYLSRLDELLGFSNLTPFKRRLAGNLSGGMKQKLGLACTLIHTPKVLFLDEPTNGVDPVSRRDFWRILNKLVAEKVTIFVSTAYLDEAERCNRVGLLNQGKLIAADTPANVKKLIKGQIIEIITDNPRQTTIMLKERYPDNSVGLFGDKVHLITNQVDSLTTVIRELLWDNDIAVKNINTVKPTLEDVFVSVLGGKTIADSEVKA